MFGVLSQLLARRGARVLLMVTSGVVIATIGLVGLAAKLTTVRARVDCTSASSPLRLVASNELRGLDALDIDCVVSHLDGGMPARVCWTVKVICDAELSVEASACNVVAPQTFATRSLRRADFVDAARGRSLGDAARGRSSPGAGACESAVLTSVDNVQVHLAGSDLTADDSWGVPGDYLAQLDQADN